MKFFKQTVEENGKRTVFVTADDAQGNRMGTLRLGGDATAADIAAACRELKRTATRERVKVHIEEVEAPAD